MRKGETGRYKNEAAEILSAIMKGHKTAQQVLEYMGYEGDAIIDKRRRITEWCLAFRDAGVVHIKWYTEQGAPIFAMQPQPYFFEDCAKNPSALARDAAKARRFRTRADLQSTA